MKKKIKINEKEYTLNSNAYNLIEYKNYFKRNMSNDVIDIINVSHKLIGNVSNVLKAINGKEDKKANMNTWRIFIERLIPLTWVLIDEKERPEYKEFAQSIDNVVIGEEWLISVIEILASSILFPRIS